MSENELELEEYYVEYWKAHKPSIHNWPLNEFVIFCIEWHRACNHIRKFAEEVENAKNNQAH